MEESRKSSESDETSTSSTNDSLSDEDELPVKKLSPARHDSDHSASSICPALSTASSEGATILRRSLRKIIEESKKDAASSSMSNSRESTPPRMSGSGRRISSRPVFSPGSSTRRSKGNGESLGTRSGQGSGSSETTRVRKQLNLQQRSTRAQRLKHNVDNDVVVKSVPSGSIASSEDDDSSVKASRKVCHSVTGVSMVTDSKRLTSHVDSSDTDSHASSLYAYNTRRSSAIGQAKLNSRGAATARQKVARRSRVFKRVADELAKLQSSDSETDGQTTALRTPFFDSFPDNSSNGSSICSSVPAPELSADFSVNNCKNDVGSSSCEKEMSAIMPDRDKTDLKQSAEFGLKEENWHGSEMNAKSPVSAFEGSVSSEVPSSLESKVTCNEKKNSDVSESVSLKVGDSRVDSACSAIEDKDVETKQEASVAVNNDRSETSEEEVKGKERASDEHLETGQTEDGEETPGDGSKVGANGVKEEQALDEKKGEVDDISNVKEEPPEILVCSYPAISIVSENIKFPGIFVTLAASC